MRIAHLAALGAAAAALTLTSALPASANGPAAAAGPLKTDRAKVTVFTEPKFQGRYTTFTRNMPNLPAQGIDGIGSARNTGKRTVTFYERIHYTGAKFSLKPGESTSHFGDHGMFDRTGSLHFS
ncbi:beta/gamma crystallin-related protein [Streptomyces sp. NPDC048611]|uniref:beta/gamma crystallin-related protein n=1 Tax=Streptomyces sp. NPDC048611 TaxID=3155635 RepID=UPI0034496A82